MKQQIVLATTNSSKMKPFVYSWNKIGLSNDYELLTFKDIENKPDFEVDQDTCSFKKDALKKALEYSKYLNLPTISVDRGIEIPSLNNWPGTKSKEVFVGYSEETKQFIKSDRTQKENEIEIANYINNKIKDRDRIVNSVYGIAIALPNGRSESDLVVFEGTASKELIITEVGWNYDWFYIPNNMSSTLSSLTSEEYIEFTGTYLWPITDKIVKFISSVKSNRKNYNF